MCQILAAIFISVYMYTLSTRIQLDVRTWIVHKYYADMIEYICIATALTKKKIRYMDR